MPLMTWELWLARDIVADNPLPRQKPLAQLTLMSGCLGNGVVFAMIGTPGQPPKPRGKSPGWSKKALKKGSNASSSSVEFILIHFPPKAP